MTDYIERAVACLKVARDQPKGHPAFRIALEFVEGDDLESAVNAMTDLDDPGMVLATMFLERRAVARGQANVEALSKPLLAQVPTGALDHGWINRRFEGAWASETAGHVPASRTASTEGRGGFSSFTLLTSVEALVENGELEQAAEQLTEFSEYDKEWRARSFALVGAAKKDDGLMIAAVDAAKKSPMIQDGGEEATALGEVLKIFAERDIVHDHPAVEACIAALLKLGKTRARKDVRSYGLSVGALAAANRGGGWDAHAHTLLDSIWTDSLKYASYLNLATRSPELLEKAGLDEELAEFFPDDIEGLTTFLRSERGPLDRARILNRHGKSSNHLLDAAIKKAEGWYNGVENIWGQILLADEAHALEIFDDLKAPEVALREAAIAYEANGDFDRAVDYMSRAFDAGFVPKYGYAASLLIRFPELLKQGREVSLAVTRRTERMEALSFIAQLFIERGEWTEAANTIDRAIEIPRSESTPEWVPWSLMGDRVGWTPTRQVRVPATTESKSADALEEVKTTERNKQLHAYYELAFDLEKEHLPALRKLMDKAPGGRGDAAQIKKAKLVEVALIADDFDGAIKIAETMKDCRISGWGPAYTAEIVATWLAERPKLMTDDRPLTVVRLIQSAIPQDISVPLLQTVSVLAPKLTPEQLDPFISAVSQFRSRFRFEYDHAAVDACAAVAAALGGKPNAKDLMADVLERARRGSYVGNIFFMRALKHADMLGESGFVRRVFTLETGERNAFHAMALERCARILWEADIEPPLAELIRADAFPSEVAHTLRRSLVVMANDYAPDPVTTILSVWLDEPNNEDLAREQITALATALEKSGEGDHAAKLRGLL